MSDPKNYTIGWLCAVHTEYVAARALLDKEHARPEYVSEHDNNDYTLGKIGKHNVVIAVLPDGEYGTDSAASVARDMLHSFPNVRIGLMVGIGGGVPSRRHDIRLGDIVVSSPRNGTGGVFEYNFGKTIQDQSFRQTRFLNQPPTVLRTAVNGLKAQYEDCGHRLEEVISGILEKKQRLRQKYKRPDPSSDRLYQPEFTHPPNNEASCAAVCGDDPSALVLRLERTESEDNPTIHYGTIASANRLMKDALIRDTLAKEKDVLCFEMEAAGLMNHFPCLVIRGICDYADSHKNKEWQGYAAMAAAAYAKDLLYRIPPYRLERDQKGQYNQREAILKWLWQGDFQAEHRRFRSVQCPGTCQWFFESDEYRSWLKQRSDFSTFFCTGIPGAGKSTLMSLLVDKLDDLALGTSDGLAYFYFSYRAGSEQTPEKVAACLVHQLAAQAPELPRELEEYYAKLQPRQKRPEFDSLCQLLEILVKSFPATWIAFDALDECAERPRQAVLGLINRLEQVGARIFATSRPHVNSVQRNFHRVLQKTVTASPQDLRRLIETRLAVESSAERLPADLKAAIVAEVSKSAHGMFLLAALQLDNILNQTSLREMRIALIHVPRTLNELYDVAKQRIDRQPESKRQLAYRILSWIYMASRPLVINELLEAVAVEEGDRFLDPDGIREPEVILEVCGSFVSIDNESGEVQLVHYTAQEYLSNDHFRLLPQKNLAGTCVTYLSFDVFESGPCQTENDTNYRRRTNVFLEYACQGWQFHGKAAGHDEQLIQRLVAFLEEEKKLAAMVQIMRDDAISLWMEPAKCLSESALHVAARSGILPLVKALVEKGHQATSKNAYEQMPFHVAASAGHAAVVEYLCGRMRPSEITKPYGWNRSTALHNAAHRGYLEVVRVLAEKMTPEQIGFRDGWMRGTALHFAVHGGHAEVVRLLLEKTRSEDLAIINANGRTALFDASEMYPEIAKMIEAKMPAVDEAAINAQWERERVEWMSKVFKPNSGLRWSGNGANIYPGDRANVLVHSERDKSEREMRTRQQTQDMIAEVTTEVQGAEEHAGNLRNTVEFPPCKVCGKTEAKRCMGCKVVAYCGKKHQKADWKVHKGVCASLAK